MDELHILHKVHVWMWEAEKRYQKVPLTDEEWSEFQDGVNQLADDLGLEHGSYPCILLAEFMHAKERYEVAIKTA